MSDADTFRRHGLDGSGLAGELVIDAHMHVGGYHNFLVPRPGLADIMASARRLGISRLYGSSLLAIRGDAESGNRDALEAQRAHLGIFFPYLVVKPNYPEEITAILDLAESTGQRRFKLHDDANDIPYDHRAYEPFYEYANSAEAVVLAHTYGRKHVGPLMNVAKRFPRIRILLGHAGIIEEDSYGVAAREHPNIYLETCCSLAWYGLVERLVHMAGADRVMFGTDMPFMSPDQQIGRILFARLTDEEKRKILGENAARVLG